MDTVLDCADGIYLVTTASGSQYRLNLDKRSVRRLIDPDGDPARHLRQDSDEINLIEVVRCELGRPLLLLIDLHLPGVWVTTRRSTAVVRIQEVSEVVLADGD